jgi:hypothetical protein
MSVIDTQAVLYWFRRLIHLDARVFDDVRSNPSATIPSVLVVLVACVIAGLGGWVWWIVNGYPRAGDIFLHSAIFGSILAVVFWGILWLGIVYLTLTQVLRQRTYFEQLMRVMGVAASPLALMALMFIPGISFAIGLASLALTFGLTAIAIKSATTADYAQVLVANFLGFLAWAAALTLLASADSSFRPHAPGVFLYNSIDTAVHEGLQAAP